MSLLSQASLVMIPSGYKEDIVYCPKPTDGSGDLTFTRASDGTRVNSAGLVENCPWNLLEQSETFQNSPWNLYSQGTGVNPVITANDTTAPNGTTTADKIVFDTGAGTSSSDISTLYQTLSNQSEGVYTASIYAKVASGTAKIVLRHAGGGTYTTLNLTSEWQRFEVTETLSGGSSFSFEIGLRRGLSNEPLTSPVTCFLWGAQINIGSTAKPYFPTTDRLNVPRLTYSGGCPSLLLEPQRTNLITYSEDLSQASWLSTQITITSNATTSPDGTQNADKIAINNGLTGGYIYQSQSTTSSTIYTGSFFVKSAGISYTKFWSNVSGAYCNAIINLSTGVITNGAFPFSTIPTATNFGNGWWRVSYTETSGGGSVPIYVDAGSTSNGGDITGNGTDGIYLWGAQLEAGSYPTSYIPTTSSSVTRVADAVNTLQTTSLLNQTNNNTVFGEFVNNRVEAGVARFFALYDSALSNNDRILLYSSHVGTTFNITLQYKVGGVTTEIALGNQTYGTPFKVACVFDSTTISFFVNGSKVDSKTVTNADNFYYAKLTDVLNDLGIETSQLILFPTALTDAECIALTTL